MLFSKFSLLPVLLGALNANGYFLQAIGSLGNKRQDPIVDTGMMFGNHSHAIMGSSNFNSVVTSDLLRSASCTSVPILEDHSNYWVPTVLFQWKNASFTQLNVGFVLRLADYLFDETNPNITAFPDNFRMISGTHTKRTYDPTDFAQLAVTFNCLDFNGVSVTYNHFPTKPCPSGIRAQINFPSCWDGVNLDSPDHKSHVAFLSEGPDKGTCNDPKFPVTIPRLFLESYWDTSPFNDIFDEAMSPSQPFMFATGDRSGYGGHADFFNGWENGVLQKVIEQCDCTIAGFGDPTCCGDKGIVSYRTNVPECTLASPSTEQVTGTLDQLPGGNIPSGLIASLNGEIYANGTWELAVPLSEQPPPVILPGVGNAVVSSPSVAASNSVFASSAKATSTLMSSAMAISTASSTKIVNTASSVKTPASSTIGSPSSVKSTNTPVSKPTSSVHSSSIAQPSSAPASGSNDNGNNNSNGDIWPTGGSSSGTISLSSESASPSPSPSSSNQAGSSSNNSNGGSSSSGGNSAPAQNSPLATSSWDSSGSGVTQVAQASATPTSPGTGSSSGSSSDNGGAGSPSSSSQGSDVNSGSSSSSSGGNEDSSSSSSSTQDSNAGAGSSAGSSAGSGSASSSSSNSGSGSSPSSGSGSDSPGNNVPAPSQQQPSNSGNATSGTAKNADKCRNRHASSLEARAAEAAPVPIKHAAISSHHSRSRAFNRLRSTGDMLA